MNRDHRTFTTDDLSAFLSGEGIEHEILGGRNSFRGVAQLDRSAEHHLAWSRSAGANLMSAGAGTIILPHVAEERRPAPGTKTLVFVDNPRNVFRLIVAGMFSDRCRQARGLDDPRFFEKRGESVWVGVNCSIAEDVVFGANVVIHPGVTIYPFVTIGDNVEILPGCVIGGPGFGHVRQADGTLAHFPHIGGVSIGNDVMVGSNTCIDSGGLSPTLIGDGCKIGNLTQIAHNVEIERNCLIGTRVQVAGGTRIGEGTDIWAGVTISNNRRIGPNCDIKIGSIVITHLPAGTVVSGNFAIPHEARLEEFARTRGPL